MFEKRYKAQTNELYEYHDETGYYNIWEVCNGRPIDEQLYKSYLDWIATGNTPRVVEYIPPVVVEDAPVES